MDYKKIITGLLSKAYKLDDGKVAELLQDGKDDANESAVLEALLTQDTERVSALLAKDTGKYQQGFAAGKKESLSELEKAAKDAFKIESDKTGLELIEEIVTAEAKAKSKNTPKEITEDDVRSHKTFIDAEKRYKEELKQKDKEIETKVNEFKEAAEKEKVQNQVAAKAQEILNGLKPSLPENQNVAQNQLNWFYQTIRSGNFKLADNGDILLLDAEGKTQTDAHGNNMDFTDYVKNKASEHFVFQQNNGGQGAGNRGVAGAGAGGNGSGDDYPAGLTRPKTEEEMWKMIADRSIPAEDREKVLASWQKENSK